MKKLFYAMAGLMILAGLAFVFSNSTLFQGQLHGEKDLTGTGFGGKDLGGDLGMTQGMEGGAGSSTGAATVTDDEDKTAGGVMEGVNGTITGGTNSPGGYYGGSSSDNGDGDNNPGYIQIIVYTEDSKTLEDLNSDDFSIQTTGGSDVTDDANWVGSNVNGEGEHSYMFSFQDTEEEKYRITATVDGYVETYANSEVTRSQSELDLSNSARVSMDYAQTLKVKDHNGSIVTTLDVKAGGYPCEYASSEQKYMCATPLGSDQTFSVEGEGWVSSEGEFGSDARTNHADEKQEFNLSLEGYSYSIAVTDENGDALESATVVLNTDNGNVSCDHVSDGTYWCKTDEVSKAAFDFIVSMTGYESATGSMNAPRTTTGASGATGAVQLALVEETSDETVDFYWGTEHVEDMNPESDQMFSLEVCIDGSVTLEHQKEEPLFLAYGMNADGESLIATVIELDILEGTDECATYELYDFTDSGLEQGTIEFEGYLDANGTIDEINDKGDAEDNNWLQAHFSYEVPVNAVCNALSVSPESYTLEHDDDSEINNLELTFTADVSGNWSGVLNFSADGNAAFFEYTDYWNNKHSESNPGSSDMDADFTELTVKYDGEAPDTISASIEGEETNCSVELAIIQAEDDDEDSDGVGDSEDLCSGTTDYTSVDSNGCSDSQRDTDGDGLYDDVDACVTEDATGQDEDQDGCIDEEPDPDPEPEDEACEEDPFTDVDDNDWEHEYVCEGYVSGWWNGKTSSSFAPNEYLTRAEAMALVTRMMGYTTSDASGLSQPAHDVDSGDWYDKYVRLGYELGITHGDYFNPNLPISKYEFNLWIIRGSGETWYGWDEDDLPPDVSTSEPTAWAVAISYRDGVITGNEDDGTFEGDDYVTRAEAAALVIRSVEILF